MPIPYPDNNSFVRQRREVPPSAWSGKECSNFRPLCCTVVITRFRDGINAECMICSDRDHDAMDPVGTVAAQASAKSTVHRLLRFSPFPETPTPSILVAKTLRNCD